MGDPLSGADNVEAVEFEVVGQGRDVACGVGVGPAGTKPRLPDAGPVEGDDPEPELEGGRLELAAIEAGAGHGRVEDHGSAVGHAELGEGERPIAQPQCAGHLEARWAMRSETTTRSGLADNGDEALLRCSPAGPRRLVARFEEGANFGTQVLPPAP